MFGGVLLVPFLVLAVLDVAVAYPSPDEELAAELTEELADEQAIQPAGWQSRQLALWRGD